VLFFLFFFFFFLVFKCLFTMEKLRSFFNNNKFVEELVE